MGSTRRTISANAAKLEPITFSHIDRQVDGARKNVQRITGGTIQRVFTTLAGKIPGLHHPHRQLQAELLLDETTIHAVVEVQRIAFAQVHLGDERLTVGTQAPARLAH
ncbi:MAG TPA: hypothetical protein DG414_06095 [Gammaproteobacteria bacterium]|nr:hypothetical protein [Gammaproteobacteria bacterium]